MPSFVLIDQMTTIMKASEHRHFEVTGSSNPTQPKSSPSKMAAIRRPFLWRFAQVRRITARQSAPLRQSLSAFICLPPPFKSRAFKRWAQSAPCAVDYLFSVIFNGGVDGWVDGWMEVLDGRNGFSSWLQACEGMPWIAINTPWWQWCIH